MRDIQGFVETRYRLLQLRPNNRNNWVTWAVAHHLDGNFDMAVQILTGYESTVVRVPGTTTATAGAAVAAAWPTDDAAPAWFVELAHTPFPLPVCTCACLAVRPTPQDEIPASEAYEHSELLLYKAQVLAEGGQQDAALALLDAEQVRGADRSWEQQSRPAGSTYCC